MKQTYNERVRALAEKMAQDYREQVQEATLANLRILISSFHSAARIAVAEAAEAVICYAYGSLEDYKIFQETGQDDDYMQRALKEQGLIPDDEQEDTRAAKCSACHKPKSGFVHTCGKYQRKKKL